MSVPQTVATVTVFDYVYDDSAAAVAGARVFITLQYSLAVNASPQVSIEPVQLSTETDTNGYWQINVVPNPNLNPTGTTYVIRTPYNSYEISVPTGPGPYQATAITVSSPIPLGVTTGSASIGGTLTVLGDAYFKSGRPWVDVIAYGADPTGTNDSTTAIQNALTAAAGGIVYVPEGVYLVNLLPHPQNASFACGLVLPSKTVLVGAGIDNTIIRLAPNQSRGNDVSGSNSMLLNLDITVGGDVDIRVESLTLDGNAANQTHTCGGASLTRVQSCRFSDVKAMNCRGTSTSGTNETKHFGMSLCDDISFFRCLSVGTAGSTASGFGASSATHLQWVDCVATGMTVGQGFTINTCRNVVYTGCRSFLNADHGFNAEVSLDVVFQGCISGGESVSVAGYPYGANTNLGNVNGFTINGTTLAEMIGCHAEFNSNDGILITTNASVAVIGGRFSNNGVNGIAIDAGSITALSSIDTGPIFGGTGLTNTTHNYSGPSQAINAWPLTPLPSTPAVPAAGTPVTNPYPFRVKVWVTGGTVTGITVNGGATGLIAGSFALQVGGTIQWAGSGAPTWVWGTD